MPSPKSHLPARNVALAVMTAGALVIEILTLHAWTGVFTGGWLGDYVLTGFGERLGLTAVLAVYALAASGMFLGIAVAALRLLRMSAARAVWVACAIWLLGLVVVSALKMQLGKYLGDAFDLELLKGLGGGTIRGAMEYVLTWFWEEALISTLLFIAFLFVTAWVTKRLRRLDLSGTRVGRLPTWVVRGVVIAAVVFVLLDASVLGARWAAVSWAMGRTSVGAGARSFVSAATDFDGDGVGAFDLPPDDAPFNAARHPFAADAPDDGLDSDGLLGDLLRDEIPEATRRRAESHRGHAPLAVVTRRNVVLVFLESFRSDLLGSRSNGKEVTPFLSSLIESGEALRVEAAWAAVGYTAPAITQAFWGGWVRDGGTLFDDLHDDNGYWCGGASGQRENWSAIDVDTELTRCDFYEDSNHDEAKHVKGGQRSVDRVLGSVDRFLESRPKDRPFFLYMNLQDCHFPYDAANPSLIWDGLPKYTSLSSANRDMLRRLYVNQAANVDRGLRELADRLKAQGVWEETILVLVSDHGESIYHDEVLGHGLRLTDNQTRIAAIFVHPTTDVPAPYAHVDLRGILRGMLGVEKPVEKPTVRVDRERRVLQLIGRIRKPMRIAHVDASGRRVIYDLARGLVLDPSTGRTTRLDAGGDLAERGRDLIRHWEYERWIADAAPEDLPRQPLRQDAQR
jgi:Sulfatase